MTGKAPKTRAERQAEKDAFDRRTRLGNGKHSREDARVEFESSTGISISMQELSAVPVGDGYPILPTDCHDIQRALRMYEYIKGYAIGGDDSDRKVLQRVMSSVREGRRHINVARRIAGGRRVEHESGAPYTILDFEGIAQRLANVLKELCEIDTYMREEMDYFTSEFGTGRERSAWPRTQLVRNLLLVRQGSYSGEVRAHDLWPKSRLDCPVRSYSRVAAGIAPTIPMGFLAPCGSKDLVYSQDYVLLMRLGRRHTTDAWLTHEQIALLLMAAGVEAGSLPTTTSLVKDSKDSISTRVRKKFGTYSKAIATLEAEVTDIDNA